MPTAPTTRLPHPPDGLPLYQSDFCTETLDILIAQRSDSKLNDVNTLRQVLRAFLSGFDRLYARICQMAEIGRRRAVSFCAPSLVKQLPKPLPEQTNLQVADDQLPTNKLCALARTSFSFSGRHWLSQRRGGLRFEWPILWEPARGIGFTGSVFLRLP
nr:unnamed protein product [Spirometra erinaceieuropaei]